MHFVIFPHRLYLSACTIKDGVIVSGFVENGYWNYKVADGMEHSCQSHDGVVRQSWPYTAPEKIVYVTPEARMFKHWQDIINWAAEQPHCTEDLQDLVDRDYIEYQNTVKKVREEYDDDDIPF